MINKTIPMIAVTIFLIPILVPAQPQKTQSEKMETQKEPDTWAPFKFFVGTWQGQGEGMNGISRGKQEFEFVLRGRYLHVKNETRFDPQEKNPKGELHEDIGLFSFDQTRNLYVLRQFHVEGFVNQYICRKILDEGKTFIFVSEQIENIPPGYRARLTYSIVNENEFQQTFDLASPGKEFECYSKGGMKRIK